MLKTMKMLMAASALSLLATPALAQDAEEPRTTYSITMLELAPGTEGRWIEVRNTVVDPARAAAGMPEQEVHWIMAGSRYHVMLISEMPHGMAVMDTHGSPWDDAFQAALIQHAGSEEALEALNEERNQIVRNSMTIFTHTHP